MLHYLTELDLDPAQTHAILKLAAEMKRTRGTPRNDLAGRHVALYFEKPSVRTRVSFTVGVHELGGHVVELDGTKTKVGKGEHVQDFAKVLGRYVSALVARVFDQSVLEQMAQFAGVPVVNALSDARHPCQALADVLTIMERKGGMKGVQLAFIGEGNNVAVSTGLLAAAFGAHVRVASPPGYGLPEGALSAAEALEGSMVQVVDPVEAARGADVLYTDTWISMGQEAESGGRRAAFKGYKIDAALVHRAKPEAMVMHCLPAVRGEEIDLDLMYAASSAIWDQAENRLHVQKALLATLLAGTP